MKVSILSAVRNESTHIGEMIQSCLDQTHEDWELLFVDDGSTDSTVQVISSYADRDRRVRLVAQQQATGKVSAFNTAFADSTGDVIVLCAGDDRLPPRSLEARADLIGSAYPSSKRVLGLFKLVTFSENAKFDGMVLPRGKSGSRSGGSLTMSRELALGAFPIPPQLAAEDVWLGEATRVLTEVTLTSEQIVLEYRIHPNNSNPRNQPFAKMTVASNKRARAQKELLESDLPFSNEDRELMAERWRLEQLRLKGAWLRILVGGKLPILDRMATAAHANPVLFRVRSIAYRWLSGLRGR